MTRTPINPSRVREGDRIRWERTDESIDWFDAVEYVANRDGQQWHGGPGNHYLIERPSPTVPLPRERALGWLGVSGDSYVGGRTRWLGFWRESNGVVSAGVSPKIDTRAVESFTLAAPVPAEALDLLSRYAASADWGSTSLDKIRDFLAAVDEANES